LARLPDAVGDTDQEVLVSTHTVQPGSALDQLSDITAKVAAHLGEPLIVACPFARRGQITQKVAGKFGLIAYLGARQHARAKAGGLPEHFFLAVTDEHVRAIGYKLGMTGKETLGEEVAVWRREDLRVEMRPGGPWIDVTLESPGEGERVECRVGTAPASEAFVELLRADRMRRAA
jgi:hypothetical protein